MISDERIEKFRGIYKDACGEDDATAHYFKLRVDALPVAVVFRLGSYSVLQAGRILWRFLMKFEVHPGMVHQTGRKQELRPLETAIAAQILRFLRPHKSSK